MSTRVEQPLIYERLTRAELAGCLAYLLMVPMLCLIGGIAGGALGLGIARLAGGGENALVLILAIVGLLAAGNFALRDYYRRSGKRIVLHSDRLEVVRRTTSENFPYEEIDWIEGQGLSWLARGKDLPLKQSVVVTLAHRNGHRLHLRNEEWPLGEISQGLLTRVIPTLARRLNDRIEKGETLEFRPGRLQSVRYLLIAFVCLGLGALLFHSWWQTMKAEKSFKLFGVPLVLVLAGASSLVMVRRSRGGITVDRAGIRARPTDPPIPWVQIREVDTIGDGANLKTADGTVLFIGMMVRNYDACLEMIRRRM